MGARFAIILPSSPLTVGAGQDAFDAGCRWLAAQGVELVPPQPVPAGALPWLAGEDDDRADALLSASRSRVDGLWLGRGGAGAVRTLAALASMPVALPLWAFSDGTTLLAYWARFGWPCWHAPPITQLDRLGADSRARVLRALAGQVPSFEDLATVVVGDARGPLAGGNLTVLASLAGTPHMPSFAGAIVVLEESGEAAYRVDRMLHQLLFAGAFDEAVGVVLGDFDTSSIEESTRVEAALVDFFRRLGLPCASGLPVGHGTRNAPLPFGRGGGWSGVLSAQAEATLVLTPGVR